MKNNIKIIQTFLDSLYADMTSEKEVITISINLEFENNLNFYFKYIDYTNYKTEILNYQVPVWLKNVDNSDIFYFENSVKSVLEEIDGISHVKKIANKLDLDIKFVIYIIANLLLVNCIALVDIFQFTNIYKATSYLKNYFKLNLLNEFNEFCDINLSMFKNRYKYKQIQDVYVEEFEGNSKLSDSVLFSLYCKLTNSQDVSDFLNKVKHYGINISLFVAFGLYKKIIRRIHIYAYLRNKEKEQENSR
jgi:hypothetical protein